MRDIVTIGEVLIDLTLNGRKDGIPTMPAFEEVNKAMGG